MIRSIYPVEPICGGLSGIHTPRGKPPSPLTLKSVVSGHFLVLSSGSISWQTPGTLILEAINSLSVSLMKNIVLTSCFFLMFFTASAQKDYHVYVFIAEACPICNYMGKPLSQVAKKYEDKVAFHAVFPVKNSNYKTSQLFKQQYELLSFETILDKDQKTAKQLGATITPEVVVTNAEGDVLYRGRINSAFYAPGKMKHSSIKDDLDLVLANLVSGKQVPQPWPSAIGCYITMYAAR